MAPSLVVRLLSIVLECHSTIHVTLLVGEMNLMRWGRLFSSEASFFKHVGLLVVRPTRAFAYILGHRRALTHRQGGKTPRSYLEGWILVGYFLPRTCNSCHLSSLKLDLMEGPLWGPFWLGPSSLVQVFLLVLDFWAKRPRPIFHNWIHLPHTYLQSKVEEKLPRKK